MTPSTLESAPAIRVIPEGEQFVKQREAPFCSSSTSLDLTADARHRQGWVKVGGAAGGKP
jgi:hypothetical protein